MGPREEDNGMLLLGAVTLLCALIAFVPWLLEPTPAMAARDLGHLSSQSAVDTSDLAPARVIVPFTPNTTPGHR
jgi:hypothetical protein